MFYNDSCGRDIPVSHRKKKVDVLVYGEVSPSTKVKDVPKNCERDCSSLGSRDHIVITGSTNDIARNETREFHKNYKENTCCPNLYECSHYAN